MDETVKLSKICPQRKNDSAKSTNSTPHDIFLVVEDNSDKAERLRLVHLDPEEGEVTSVGNIMYLKLPSVVVSCTGSIFCLGDNDCSGLVHEFDLFKRTSRTPMQLVEPVRQIASAASSHEILVSGGENEWDDTVGTCSVYVQATNCWTPLYQLRQARRSHRMCWLPDGRVFAIGGYCYRVGYLSSVEMLERAWIPAPREEELAEWQHVAPMKTGRHDFGCCVFDGRIVVAGGWTVGAYPSSSVESFEPPTATNIGQWTSLTDLASRVGWCFLVPSTAGLVLINHGCGEMQLRRRKAKVASSEWTWEPRRRLASFEVCHGLVSLPTTAGVSQR